MAKRQDRHNLFVEWANEYGPILRHRKLFSNVSSSAIPYLATHFLITVAELLEGECNIRKLVTTATLCCGPTGAVPFSRLSDSSLLVPVRAYQIHPLTVSQGPGIER